MGWIVQSLKGGMLYRFSYLARVIKVCIAVGILGTGLRDVAAGR
jgi:hypothetical protein